MADQCIVCLEDLGTIADAVPAGSGDLQDAGAEVAAQLPFPQPGRTDNHQLIALIKPCNHVLHDECLREWSQKANSCPICRHAFNLVEVLDKVGGAVLSEYAVEDKKQVADFDPTAWMQDQSQHEEDVQPCPICGEADQEDVLLLCDGCDAPYHTHCIGLDRVPRGQWYCMECESEGAYVRAEEPMEPTRGRHFMTGRDAPRTQASVRRTRQRENADNWQGTWGHFANRVHDYAGLDLEFSDEDGAISTSYRQHQRRNAETLSLQRRQYRQRLDIAGQQGAGDIFRQAAPRALREPRPQTPVETLEETRAWGDFEKAKELDTTSPKTRKRKSRSATNSPAEPPAEPERKLKRPRTRRVLDQAESSAAATPMMASTSRVINGNRHRSPPSRPDSGTNGGPSFLSSLLKEVEMATTSDEDTSRSAVSTVTAAPARVTSPTLDYSSPAASPSPSSSTYHTPRAMSITPPPHITNRRGSPVPLTSRVEANFPPSEYSPNRSPPDRKPDRDQYFSINPDIRQPRPRRRVPVVLPRSEGSSPVRATMSSEAKEGINKIVKVALAPHWRTGRISKERYAEINRDVSRKLYEIVADRDIDDETEKQSWEKIATAEVQAAVTS